MSSVRLDKQPSAKALALMGLERGSSTKDILKQVSPSHAANPDELCFPTLYYYAGETFTKSFCGHVAISLPNAVMSTMDRSYLSFRKNTDKESADLTLKNTVPPATIENDTKIYGGEKPTIITLPLCKAKDIMEAAKVFGNMTLSSYNLATKNCANACLQFMDTLYKIKKDRVPATPQYAAEVACNILLADIATNRKTIREEKSEDNDLGKVTRLIDNDIKKLEIEIERAKLQRVTFEITAKMKAKITELESLKANLEKYTKEGGFNNSFNFLMSVQGLYKTVKDHIEEYLENFPCNKLLDFSQKKDFLKKLSAVLHDDKELDNSIKELRVMLSSNELTCDYKLPNLFTKVKLKLMEKENENGLKNESRTQHTKSFYSAWCSEAENISRWNGAPSQPQSEIDANEDWDQLIIEASHRNKIRVS